MTASFFDKNNLVSATDISASLRVTFHSLPFDVSYSLIETSHFLYECCFSITLSHSRSFPSCISFNRAYKGKWQALGNGHDSLPKAALNCSRFRAPTDIENYSERCSLPGLARFLQHQPCWTERLSSTQDLCQGFMPLPKHQPCRKAGLH